MYVANPLLVLAMCWFTITHISTSLCWEWIAILFYKLSCILLLLQVFSTFNIMEIFIDTLHWYLLCAGTIKQLALACAGRDGQYTIIIFVLQIQKGQTTLGYCFVFSHLTLIAWISLSNYLNLTDGLINH